MSPVAKTEAIPTITTHYIDGAFVESHGREVIDILRPTDGQVIARVTLADEEDTRRAIAAARRSFATYSRSTPDERAKLLRRLHAAASARLDDLTAAMGWGRRSVYSIDLRGTSPAPQPPRYPDW